MNRIAGLLGMAAKSGQLLAGTASVEAAVKRRQVLLVICGGDLSARTIRNFKNLCETYQVDFSTIATIAELGQWIGRPGRGVLGVKSPRLAKAIKVSVEERLGDPSLTSLE
jgi:ribosomal protein L7Ae-like RNA K-turn-binding protein